MLHLLSYMSTSQDFIKPVDLCAILEISVANNIHDGISGILMYHDGLFFKFWKVSDY